MGGKSSSAGSAKDYYGSCGFVFAGGPWDTLSSMIVDGATVWPTRRSWNDDITNVQLDFWKRLGGYVTIHFLTPHGLKVGNKFQLTGSGGIDGTYTLPAPSATVSGPVTYITDLTIRLANAGADTEVDDQGVMQKVDHYLLNAIVRYGAAVWLCVLTHDATAATAPPNATYWSKYVIQRGGMGIGNPFVFTAPGLGTCHWYWGTQTQNWHADSVLATKGHPPYRGQGFLELIDCFFGTERQGPPNIEIVGTRAPQQTIVVGGSAALDGDNQANPIAVLAELVTDPIFGLGLPAARFDATSWQAVADALATQSARSYISPLLETGQSFRQVLAYLLAYFDGWLRFNSSGVIEAGRFLHNEAPPAFTDATTIDFNDCVEEITWQADGWPATFNETVCAFQDRLRAFKDAGQMSVSSYNRAVTGEPRRSKLDRPWITRQQQASDYAAEWGKINAQPQITGKLVVRAVKAASIKQGDLFKLTHDAASYSVVCRCTGRTLAKPAVNSDDIVTLRFASERGIAPIPFQPTSANPGGTVFPPAETISFYQFVQPPPVMAQSYEFPLFVLAAKTSEITRGFRLWMKVDDTTNFYEIGEQRGFAVPGALTQNYDASATTDDDNTEALRLSVPESIPQAELDRISASQTDDAINDNALLVFLFKAADPTQFEICTLKAIRLDTGVYKLKVKRSQFSTEQLNFVTGDTAWIIYRSDLVVFFHQKFSTYVPGATAADFRLQAFNTEDEGDVSDTDQCPDISFTFNDIHLPTVLWEKIQDNSGGGFAATAGYGAFFPIATKFKVWLSASSTTGVIDQVQITAELGSAQIVLYTASNSHTPHIAAQTPAFVFPDVGAWQLYAIVKEASGRTTKSPFANQILIGDGTKCASPVISIGAGGYEDGPSGTVVVSTATAGATVYYAFENPDYIPTQADLIASAGGVTPQSFTFATTMKEFWLFDIFWSTGYKGRRTFWAFARKAGKTDSDMVRYDFWYQPP